MQLLNLKPYIYGFDLDKNNNNYSRYYSKTKLNFNTDHDLQYENILIKKFLNEKKIFEYS